MGMAVVKRLFAREDLETLNPNLAPNLELDTAEQLSPEELEEFKEILERYSKGDAHERLNLWLYHRDLRETFTVLEQNG